MGFVEITNVRKVFGGKGKEVVALDEANLTFNEGEFVALIGPSGCGKTTLLTIVAGLASKTSGSVKVGGKEVTGPYPDYGFVFQQPSLMPWRSVLQNVLFPMEILGRNDAQAKARAEQLLEMTGLHAFANARPHELSGGMQQRVSLCRALIHKPKLLLMDEPFGALDEFTRLDMNDLLLKIKAETGASVLFVTHSISEAVYLSDKVVVFTRRPARVSAEFQINIPAPRTQACRFTPEFIEAEKRASEALGLLVGAH
ncbi:ABC transporter ATP-binding protein [Methylocella sp. CPCC 101449]|jgi:NitT/TauT family transport system ATP-binding protein|uniref:ABC transporter ATP-binding protein n=1 Tax=Methylocella sp. CPCC 101449 TaxID=2987531 RepID=UPI00288ECA61|nr:ABC transporter ATP-binding protein [Methylocella sp. CPCC 101449]MDT2019421.1 ABC transporter ATP-binding protein [Methylocella sp. CPCC 101449]HEV2573181.1 ABC transporter ATP-binding protein [Beijerinckiaceae bacterium]